MPLMYFWIKARMNLIALRQYMIDIFIHCLSTELGNNLAMTIKSLKNPCACEKVIPLLEVYPTNIKINIRNMEILGKSYLYKNINHWLYFILLGPGNNLYKQ